MEIGGDQWNAINETAMAESAADTEMPAIIEPAAANVSVSEVKTEESTKGNIYIEYKNVKDSVSVSTPNNENIDLKYLFVLQPRPLRKMKSPRLQLHLKTTISKDVDKKENLRKTSLSLFMKTVRLLCFGCMTFNSVS